MSQIVYQLKISLNGSEPPVWRRVQVLGSTHLSDLHDMLQEVMGWRNEDFYQFIIEDRCYGDTELGSGENRGDAEQVSLGALIRRPKMNFIYEYDFNDGWEHEIIVEKIRPVPDQDGHLFPHCLEGENACPPEGCGGIFGYYELLSLLKDPSHPAYAEMQKLYGVIEPKAFDLAAINKRLQALFDREAEPESDDEDL